jgi:hypothetical protein
MKQPDPAASMAKLLKNFNSKQNDGLRVADICRVLTFDAASCRATVQPLIRSGSDDPAPIQNVPAIGQRLLLEGSQVEQVYKPALHVGDVVLVLFADQEIKNGLAGRVTSPDTQRRHDKNDAVIIGVFPVSL